MENKNEVIKDNNSNEYNDLHQKIEKDITSNIFENKMDNNSINLRIENRKFIEEIFKYSEESNELIPIFKENSNENLKDYLNLF